MIEVAKIVVCAGCATLLAGVASVGAATVAERGAPAAWRVSVKPSSTAADTLAWAAQEFTEYVRGMTDVSLPVVNERTLSDTNRVVRLEFNDAFGESEYRMRSANGGLVVTGGKRGVLYAVYDILETYGGVGWYASWRTVVPRLDAFTVPDGLNRFVSPAFKMREPAWYDCAYNSDFAARLRANGHITWFHSRHGGLTSMYPQWEEDGFSQVHTFAQLIPESLYGSSHPEFFSARNGVRVPGKGSQLCLTCPDLLDEMEARLRVELAKWYPKGQYRYSVSQNDNRNYCTCAACAAVDAEEGSPAGSLIRFVNALAGRLTNDYPKVVLSTLAYTYTENPPTTRPAPNVIIVLCPVLCRHSAPIETSPDTSTLRQNVAFRTALEGWAALTDNIQIWDYTVNFSHYMLPYPNVGVMHENLKYFKRKGVKYIFSQGKTDGGPHADFAELKTWLTAKWLWNPNLEQGPLVDRFMAGYYGAASNLVKQIFLAQEALVTPSVSLQIYQEPSEAKWLTDAHLDWADGVWRQAESAVADDPECLYNVRMSRMATLYARLFRTFDKIGGITDWLCARPRALSGIDVAAADRDWITNMLANALAFQRVSHPKLSGIALSEKSSLPNDEIFANWASALAAPVPLSGPRRIVFGPISGLTANEVNKHGETIGCLVQENGSYDGTVLELNNIYHDRAPTKGFRSIAFDPATNYVLRIRVKVVKTPSAASSRLTAFGMYVYHDDIGCLDKMKVRSKDVGDGWQIYELRTTKTIPKGAYFYFQAGDDDTPVPHPDYEKIVFDRLEIERPATYGLTLSIH